MGKPIFPVFGIINGGSSLIISLDLRKNKNIMPTKANNIIAKR